MELRRQDVYYSANKNNNKNNNIKSINKNNENIIVTEKEENLIKENEFFIKDIIAKIAEENRKIKYKSITNDEKIEREAWNKCLICEEEYREDIRMNNYCFHSYCKECIDQTSVPSICSFCSQHFSSQPVNFTLSYWKSLSPSPLLNLLLNNNNNHNKNNNNNNNSKNYRNKNSKIEGLEPSFISFYKCEKHVSTNEKMRLFCEQCDQFICTYCLDEAHYGHPTISVQKFVDRIKQNWINNIENAKKSKPISFDNIIKKENDLIGQLLLVDFEINSLEEKINELKLKKIQLNDQLNEIRSNRAKIDQASGYLRRFVQSLPPLPLSSFHSFSPLDQDKNQKVKPIDKHEFYSYNSNIYNNNNKNKNNVGKEEKEEEEEEGLVGRRIKDFFEKDHLHLLFSLLLFPSSPNTLQQIDLLFHQPPNNNNNMIPNYPLHQQQNNPQLPPNPNANPAFGPQSHPQQQPQFAQPPCKTPNPNSNPSISQAVQGGLGFLNRFFGNIPLPPVQPPQQQKQQQGPGQPPRPTQTTQPSKLPIEMLAGVK